MKNNITTLLVFITLATIIGCSTSKNTVKNNTVEPLNITFEKDIKPITESFCGGSYCHHGTPSFWSKYENMKAIVDNGELHEEVIEKKTMPMGVKLPTKEYNLIKAWLENGAKK
jgi:hypothetical protein